LLVLRRTEGHRSQRCVLRLSLSGTQMSMDLARFSQLLGEPGPFASVYFDEADDIAASLTLKWRALRDKLE